MPPRAGKVLQFGFQVYLSAESVGSESRVPFSEGHNEFTRVDFVSISQPAPRIVRRGRSTGQLFEHQTPIFREFST